MDKPPTKRPHKGRVVGAGVGHKHSHHYPEKKEDREERKRQETVEIRKLKDSMTTTMESIPEQIKQQVAAQISVALLAQQQTLLAWDMGGRKGPMPLISSIDDSNSGVAPNQEAPATEAPIADAPAMEAPAARQSPAVSVPRSSPSVSCAPALGPTPLAELNALTVINPRCAQHYIVTSSLPIILRQACFRRPTRFHAPSS